MTLNVIKVLSVIRFGPKCNEGPHRRTGNFLPGGGGKPFAQKILASCLNFYKTVEQKRGPYDATT